MVPTASLEQSLERCLGELARTGDIEASLRRCPRRAEQLRPLLEVAQVTERFYAAVPEAPGGLKAGRDRLLAAAAQERVRRGAANPVASRVANRLGYQGTKLAFALRLISVLLAIVVGVTAVGGGVVWAASDDLPGDLLYPVKMVVEEARLTLASAPEDRADLALRFFGERVEEIRRLLKAGRQVPDTVIMRMERHLERALVQAAWVSDEKMAGVLRQIVRQARTQAEILTLERERRESTDSQQVQAMLRQAVAVCQWGADTAEYGLREPQAFRYQYRHQRGIAHPTETSRQATATPGEGQGGDPARKQWRDQERVGTPAGTPHATPPVTQTVPGLKDTLRGPWVTPGPHMAPEGPETAPGPRATSQGPQATVDPSVTPAEPRATAEPQTTPERPQATSEPQATPGAQATREPQATPQRPRTTPGPQATRRAH